MLYCKTVACGACMHALTASMYLNSKVADWNSQRGNAVLLPTNLPALVRCIAVVLVLSNTLVLYCKTLARGACMHALTASVYLNSKVADWNSQRGNAVLLPTNLPALVRCIAVVLVLSNTLVLYCKTLARGACMPALTASMYLNSKVADWNSQTVML